VCPSAVRVGPRILGEEIQVLGFGRSDEEIGRTRYLSNCMDDVVDNADLVDVWVQRLPVGV
jgi:hypothetical protein